MINNCQICGKKYERFPSQIGRYCSRRCVAKARKGVSSSPKTEFKKGETNHHWKGGKYKNSDGYIEVKVPSHPFGTKRDSYICEHRLVMEKLLGRYLQPHEKVHHINGVRNDNRPENLMLYVEGKNWHPKTCPKCGFCLLIK